MPTPFTHFTQSALSLRNFTQLYTALRISTHFTHFTQSSKTLGTLRTLRNLRELTYFTQLYSALRKAKILYATLRGGETLYASFTRRLRKVHLLYAHFTHTLRNFTQFNALYARPDYFTQLYAHGNLLMVGSRKSEIAFSSAVVDSINFSSFQRHWDVAAPLLPRERPPTKIAMALQRAVTLQRAPLQVAAGCRCSVAQTRSD